MKIDCCSELIDILKKLDCGDNSCYFAHDKNGMRTNGGCRCLTSPNCATQEAIRRIWNRYKESW
jgi:hypothetical protein